MKEFEWFEWFGPSPIEPFNSGRDPRQTDDGTCLANAVATTYLNVASKEYNDRTRIGYMYFGHQSSGGYGQWPMTDLEHGAPSM